MIKLRGPERPRCDISDPVARCERSEFAAFADLREHQLCTQGPLPCFTDIVYPTGPRASPPERRVTVAVPVPARRLRSGVRSAKR